ncbi:MAG: hypothetical protein KGS72_04605 [Cyanobacteria bacterium REEB67]|nr:hypothetical protein [Cyanobacteria bacterium REEB67]
MAIAIFLIVLFGAAVLGHFLIKKERARQLERRERRVRIAEGNFDGYADEPAPTKKRFWQRRKQKTLTPMTVSEKTAEELNKLFPAALEKVFEARKVYRDAKKDASDACDLYVRRKQKLANMSYPEGQPAATLRAFISQLAAQYRAVEEAAAQHLTMEKLAQRAFHSLRADADVLARATKATEHYDLSPLSPELRNYLSVAALLVPELPLKEHVVSRSHQYHDREKPLAIVPAEDRRLQSEDLLTADLVEIYLEKLTLILPLVEELSTASDALSVASSMRYKLQQGPGDVPSPEKPTDQDVQTYIGTLTDWVASIDEAKLQVQARQLVVKDGLDALSRPLAALCKASDNANDVAREGGKCYPSAELQAANHCRSQIQKICELARKALPDSLRSATAAAEPQPPLPLSEQAKQIDESLSQALKAAMRKLGFAIAQQKAANARLATLAATSEPQPTCEAPSLNETNVEVYLRRHSQWVQASGQLAEARKNRDEKISAAREQARQRAEQVPQAAQALAALLSGLTYNQIVSKELYACIEASVWMANAVLPKVKKENAVKSPVVQVQA